MILSGKLSPEYEAVTLEMTFLRLSKLMEAGGAGTCQRPPVRGHLSAAELGNSLFSLQSSPSKTWLACRRSKVGSGGIIDTECLLPRFSVCVLHACCVYCMCASCVWYEVVHSVCVLSCVVQVRKQSCGDVG